MCWRTRRARYAAFTARLQPPQPSPAVLVAGLCLPPPVSKAVRQQPARAAPRLRLPAQNRGSGRERLFEPFSVPALKAALCCAQVTQLVQFLIEQQEELLGEEVSGLASGGDEEAPAPPAEAETAEVCEVHKEYGYKSLPPQKLGLLPQGQAPGSRQPAALPKRKARRMQVGHPASCGDPTAGSAELSSAIQGLCLSELRQRLGREVLAPC